MKRLILPVLLAGLSVQLAPAHAQLNRSPVKLPGLLHTVQTDESFRINELEDKVRQLNGQVEELNFLLLQMQEKLRRMEEDNESRFQELEDKQGNLGERDTQTDVAEAGETKRLEKPKTSGLAESPDAIPAADAADGEDDQIGSLTDTLTKPAKPPTALGTLTFDSKGNVVDSAPQDAEILNGLPGLFSDGIDGGVEAAKFGPTPSLVLASGVNALRARRFKLAEQAFTAHLKAWPKDPDAGKVKFYLGETYFWQKQYYEAATAHLDAHNNYPETDTAADNLLALGLALAGLNQREVACATYAEVLKQYPDAEARLGQRIKNEQTSTKC